MVNTKPATSGRVGPFLAGSSASDLTSPGQLHALGLRIVDQEEQTRDYYRQRSEGLRAAAKEFFYNYEEATPFIFEKADDSHQLPDFIQFIYCWVLEDRLAGLILFGVNSEAGTHEEIDQHEKIFREQSDEAVEALADKYTKSPESIINYFNFEVYTAPPAVPVNESKEIFLSIERLVTATEQNEKRTRIVTEYCGPTVVLASQRRLGAAVSVGAAHTRQFFRKIFASDEFFVVYDHDIVRYVRTIESLHVSTSLVYLSRHVMDDLGQSLNSRRGAKVQAEAQREVVDWQNKLSQAEEARRIRISKLSQVL